MDHPPSEIQWAKLAAYIDGEGSINIVRVKRGEAKGERSSGRLDFIFVTIVNTDPRLVVWCREVFGGKILQNPRKEENRAKHKPCYEWKVGSNYAREILEGCLPHFIIKCEQAEIAIAFTKTLLRRGGQLGAGKGQPRVSPEVLSLRDHYHDEIRRVRAETVAFPDVDTSSVS